MSRMFIGMIIDYRNDCPFVFICPLMDIEFDWYFPLCSRNSQMLVCILDGRMLMLVSQFTVIMVLNSTQTCWTDIWELVHNHQWYIQHVVLHMCKWVQLTVRRLSISCWCELGQHVRGLSHISKIRNGQE